MTLTGAAKIAGVIGWPVGHALSPLLHGYWLAENGIDGAMVPLAVRPEDFAAVLRGVRGRMERAARLPNGATAYVDFAHTPDALERLLTALRPHTGGKLHVVFGAGGDRDRGKRPLMGEVAARLADRIIVTDDNPRGELPHAIRSQVMAGCPNAREIGDRARAIEAALNDLGSGDVLVVAGKGHEQGQTIAGVVHPFDDVRVVRGLVGVLS